MSLDSNYLEENHKVQGYINYKALVKKILVWGFVWKSLTYTRLMKIKIGFIIVQKIQQTT